MKHHSPQEIASVATTYVAQPQPRMSRRERLDHWASILERHEGPLNPLRQIEYLSPEERRAYRRADTPLTVAFSDAVLREEGLKSDRLGDTMEFFGLSDFDAHHLFCDCRYFGAMTGGRVAERLRRHAAQQEFRARVGRVIARLFGRAA